MAFKIAQKPVWTHLVKVSTPNDKGGFDESTFTAKFRKVTMTELDSLRQQPQVDVIKSVLVGFAGLLDEDDKEVEFSDTNLAILTDIPEAVHAIAQTFWANVIKAPAKN